MAIYHLSNKYVSRGAGQSAVAAAAYQSRSSLYNERDGLQKNYTRHGTQELLYSAIYTPKNAPEWTHDRERLWNEAEAAEDAYNKTRAKSARVAQHITLALPHELDLEENRRLVVDFVRDNFTRKGYVADINIHAPDRDGDERNIHAHIMLTMRKIDGQEFSEEKERISKGELRERLEKWRENWAQAQARHLERAGFQMEAERMRYSHKTLEQQQEIAKARGDKEHAAALEREATQHEGATLTKMKREGKTPDSHNVIDFNKAAADRAERLRELNAQKEELAKEEAQIYHINKAAEKLHRLERVQEWQSDRLTLKQERETAKLEAAHEWERHTQRGDFAPLNLLRERERQQAEDDLKQKHESEREALEAKHRAALDKIASQELQRQEAEESRRIRAEMREARLNRRHKAGYDRGLSPADIAARGREAIADAERQSQADAANQPHYFTKGKEGLTEDEQAAKDKQKENEALKRLIMRNRTNQTLTYGDKPAPATGKESYLYNEDGGQSIIEPPAIDDPARYAPDWTRKEGGEGSLSDTERTEAKAKYDEWTAQRRERAEKHGTAAKEYSFDDYVTYVQEQEGKRQKKEQEALKGKREQRETELQNRIDEVLPNIERRDQAAAAYQEQERQDIETRTERGAERAKERQTERETAPEAERSAWWKAAQSRLNHNQPNQSKTEAEQKRFDDFLTKLKRKPAPEPPQSEHINTRDDWQEERKTREREAEQLDAQRKAQTKTREHEERIKRIMKRRQQANELENDNSRDYEP